jgi:hypothetical protein
VWYIRPLPGAAPAPPELDVPDIDLLNDCIVMALRVARQRLVQDGGRLGYLPPGSGLPIARLHVDPPGNQSCMSLQVGADFLEYQRLRLLGCLPTPPAVTPIVVEGALFLLLWRVLRHTPELRHLYLPAIPVLAGFHHAWHVLRGIFRLYGPWLLRWAHVTLGRHGTFDHDVKVFEKGERLLEVVASAILLWLHTYLGRETSYDTMLDRCRRDAVAYNLVVFVGRCALPYFHLRALLRSGSDPERLALLQQYFLSLFHATGKHNYVEITLRWTWTLSQVHPDVRHLLLNHCMSASVSGRPNSGQAFDMLVERVSTVCKSHQTAFFRG